MINHKTKEDSESYDARKRDPQFAHASSSPLWELVILYLSFKTLNLCPLYISYPSSTITTLQSRCMPVNFCRPNHSQPPQISLKIHCPTFSIDSSTRTLNKSKMGIPQEAEKVLAQCNRRPVLSMVSS